MTWPNWTKNTQDRPRPLKYETGTEVARSHVLASSTVDLNDNTQRIVAGGTLLCKITSGDQADKYGPYDGTASDGRQTISEDAVGFTRRGIDVTLGDRPVELLYAMCVFDKSELTGGQGSVYNFHSTPLTNLKAALPSNVFDD